MYTFSSIASSQRVPTEINESDTTTRIKTNTKTRISVESDTVIYLKTFRIISGETPISLLILS